MYHCVWGASSSRIIKIHYFRNSSNVSDSIIRFQLEKFTVCLSKKIVPHLFTICFIHIFRSEFCDWCRPHKNASNNFRDLCTKDMISIFFLKYVHNYSPHTRTKYFSLNNEKKYITLNLFLYIPAEPCDPPCFALTV